MTEPLVGPWNRVIEAAEFVELTYKRWLVRFSDWDLDRPFWNRRHAEHEEDLDLFKLEDDLSDAANALLGAVAAAAGKGVRLPAAIKLTRYFRAATPILHKTPEQVRAGGEALWHEALDWKTEAETRLAAVPSRKKGWKRRDWMEKAKSFVRRVGIDEGRIPNASEVAEHVGKAVSTITRSVWWRELTEVPPGLDIETILQSDLSIRGRPRR